MKKVDYRHFISIGFLIVSVLLLVFVFPFAFGRFFESVRDLYLSLRYYFETLIFDESQTLVTVISKSDMPFELAFGLPESAEELSEMFSTFFGLFFDKNNFLLYLVKVVIFLYNFLCILLLVLPAVIFFVLYIRKSFDFQNNDYNVDSKPLRFFKKFYSKTVLPVIFWIKVYWSFLKAHKWYIITFLCVWAFSFNCFSIVICALAYYFYFVFSFDFAGLIFQFYKLFFDLSPMINFLPLAVWLVIGFLIFDRIRKKIALTSLKHKEMKNRGFINSLPIVYMVCGTMGKKKTTTITDMALSQEVMFRDKAFEKILENDLKFPSFPWINFENEIKRAMESHRIYNLATCRKYVRFMRDCFYLSETSDKSVKKSILRYLKKDYGYRYSDLLFDYDYQRYGLTYDNKLKVVDVWEVLENYAQLYFIYVIQSSLILSNYSVRTDNLLSDIGNFPLWDNDFFKRDSRLIDSYSRHSHILDFDSLRLGKKLLEENPNRDCFEFGVVLITEIGKERGNVIELADKIKKAETANQKNDLFNSWLKMIRHSGTVDNFPFVRVITDEQRPESWGLDARSLCQIVSIKESSDMCLAMPFFTVGELLCGFAVKKFSDLYYHYRFSRGDNCLSMWLLKKFTAKIQHFYTGIYNRFGYFNLTMQVESGTQDGEICEHRYFLSSKKIYSKRFSTDCFSDFFTEKALRSRVGIDDISEYATEKATFNELHLQNSYFVNDLEKGFFDKKDNIDEKEKKT